MIYVRSLIGMHTKAFMGSGEETTSREIYEREMGKYIHFD